jgi:hypothetical protein
MINISSTEFWNFALAKANQINLFTFSLLFKKQNYTRAEFGFFWLNLYMAIITYASPS